MATPMRTLGSYNRAQAPLWLNQSNAPKQIKPDIMKIIAMRVAKKPEIASVDATAETLISADKKYIEVYEKQSGHWKPKIIKWQEIGRTKSLFNL
jgi:pyruvate/2-oxoglutarate dehydrogenase complex dihydrolipoamide dehydrogenase (E3) component